jgi:diguanylate cyclase
MKAGMPGAAVLLQPVQASGRWVARHARILLALALLALADLSGAVGSLDDALSSMRMSFARRADTGTVAVVSIDAPSLASAGTWPWPRDRFARAINNLRSAGANLIAFDVDFSASSTQSSDRALEDAIEAQAGWIVLPTFVQRDRLTENRPLASISKNAIVGSVNIDVDDDGKVRRYARGYAHNDHYYPTIASILASVPYGDQTSFLIDYGIRPDRIPQISFEHVLENRFDPGLVRGRNILIGATAVELGDDYPTPTAAAMPGVMVHALAYESLAQGRTLLAPNAAISLGLAVIALLLLWPRPGSVAFYRFLVRHAAILFASILGPLIVQSLAPVSVDVGLVVLAQALCMIEAISSELARRRLELARQREEHLAHIATHDPETLLPNRRAMQDQFARQVVETNGRAILAIAIGIDKFPMLRSAIGYAGGNQLVTDLAGRLALLADVDQVFHLSTSVLGVLVQVDGAVEDTQRWDQKFATLDTRFEIEGQQIDVIVRIGMASTETLQDSPEPVLERATTALDQSRIRKIDSLLYSDAAINPKLQLALVGGVARGIDSGQFTVVYQPKVSARQHDIIGAEALVRWNHPEFGPISPALFIGVMEETGAIDSLSRWILTQVIRDQSDLRKQGMSIPIAVNLSARLVSDPEFCDFAIKVIQAADAMIAMEITETAMIDNQAAALAGIERLRAAGIGISIDDYGAGLSSLIYLKQIPADELKIDRSLILDITHSLRDRMIIKSTTDLAHSLGMKVVAEGVEDAETSSVLALLGCDGLQGYHFGRPGPAAALLAWSCDARTQLQPLRSTSA